jgi:hypothetical protein
MNQKPKSVVFSISMGFQLAVERRKALDSFEIQHASSFG